MGSSSMASPWKLRIRRRLHGIGSVVTIPSVEVRFVKPGLFTRFLRLSIRPESTFFFLVAGLALVAFEFYAAGVGVTAAVAVLSLFLATYGIASLPVRWWAVALAIFGIGAYTWDFQRNRLGWRSLLGTAGLLLGGLQLTDAAPRFEPRWWVILLIVAGLALFLRVCDDHSGSVAFQYPDDRT